MELPALGYPISSQAITDWFRATYKREPSTEEVGRVTEAMMRRDATVPDDTAPTGEEPGFKLPDPPLA